MKLLGKEIYVKIEGFPLYEISNYGNIRSWKNGKFGIRGIPRIMKTPPNKYGYMSTVIGERGNYKTVFPHKLVAIYFISERPTELHQVRHIDGDKENNWHTNIEWGTSKENAADRERHGTTARGETSGRAKLVEEDIPAILALKKSGATYTELSKQYHVSRTTLRSVVDGKSWKHLNRR